MDRKRHEMLGRKLHTSRETCLEAFAQQDAINREYSAPGRPHQQFPRQMELETIVAYVVLEHLGYEPVEDLTPYLTRGVDRAVEYFLGDWWMRDKMDALYMDKSRPDRELHWFDVLPNALLLGGLTGRWDDVSKICSWFDESVGLEYQGGLVADEYMIMLLCIASSLGPRPMAGIDAMVATVKACRSRAPKLLCALWEATMAKDQKRFDKALKGSVQHFLKVGAQNLPNPNLWVARDQSCLWLVAERNGLKFPELPEQIDAAIVRRQTIGLA